MKEDIRKAVKEAVASVDPQASVILYGSRARGDAREDSDWDLLVITEQPADHDHEDAIRGAIYEIEWDTGQVLSVILRSRVDWEQRLQEQLPFSRNVAQEGVLL